MGLYFVLQTAIKKQDIGITYFLCVTFAFSATFHGNLCFEKLTIDP